MGNNQDNVFYCCSKQLDVISYGFQNNLLTWKLKRINLYYLALRFWSNKREIFNI